MTKTKLFLAVLLAGCSSACNRGDDADTSATPADDVNLVATAELLVPLRGVSTVEAEFGRVAAGKAMSPEIRTYAQTIAADHTALIAALDSAAQAMKLPAVKETATAQELTHSVRTAHGGQETLSGAEYDQAYIRAEVESNRELLARLDQELIPGAGDAATRTLLTDVRAMVDAHLTRSRQLLALLLDRPTTPPASVRPAQPAAPVPPVSTGG